MSKVTNRKCSFQMNVPINNMVVSFVIQPNHVYPVRKSRPNVKFLHTYCTTGWPLSVPANQVTGNQTSV